MFRNLSLAVIILAITSFSAAQNAKDPLSHRHPAQSRIKTSSVGPHSTVAPTQPHAKANGVDTQLNQIERQSIKSQSPAVHRSVYPVVTRKENTTRSANQPVNFQYHGPKATTTSQPAGGSGGATKAGGVHRGR